MIEKIKKNISLIFVLALTLLCGTIDYYGIGYYSYLALVWIWHLSIILIIVFQKKNIKRGLEYIRNSATNAEAFIGICHIGFSFVWVFAIAVMATIYPLGFCSWSALEVPYETFNDHLFWYTLKSLAFGMLLLVFFCFICSILYLPITIIGRSLFKDDYTYVRFPNIWLDYCALPIALFAYITQLTGAADLYGAFTQITDLLS